MGPGDGFRLRRTYKNKHSTTLGRLKKSSARLKTCRRSKKFLPSVTSEKVSRDQESIVKEILLDDTSSDDSEKNFAIFLETVSSKQFGIVEKRSSSNEIGFQNFLNDSENWEDISEDKGIKMIHYNRSNGNSRNSCGYFYPCDHLRRQKVQKRDIKSSTYMNGFNCHSDSSSKYRCNRPRSLSPNLPKIPYLEKPHYQNHSITSTARKSRVIFKNRPIRDSNQHQLKPNNNGSKKSIPDHALMKNLLSGLSIFENDDDVTRCASKNIQKHKSMGNIKSSSGENCTLKVNYKSTLNFRDNSTIGNISEETFDNFRDYYNNFKRKECFKNCPRKENESSSCEFDNYCCFVSGDRISDERNENFDQDRPTLDNCVPDGKSKPQRCCTLVEKRRIFFENREKQFEKDNMKVKPNMPLLINCVGKQIQDDFGKCDEITEIYRNFRSVHSNSTLSKRSSSLPPISKLRRSNVKCGELFNPDYNFCYGNGGGGGGGGRFKNSIIESIRSKVFQTSNSNIGKNDYNDDWSTNPAWFPKFPKETRNAMSIILSNKNSSVSCKYCHEKFRKKQVVHIETQTSPNASECKIGPPSKELNKVPCPKNLLCEKGYHPGKCDENLRRRLDVVCDEKCICKEARRMLDFEELACWPGQAVRIQRDENAASLVDSQEFLKSIRPDLDTSEEHIDWQRPLRYDPSSNSQPITTTITTTSMNGLNGHTNGDLNGCGDIITQNQQRGCWTIGLINSKYRYLTAETFGFKINANGASLKKKQIWTLEPDTSSGSDTCVYLKSHLDKYLAVDSFGNVTCESDEKEPGSKFQVTVAEDNTGRWAFRNVVRGYFLGSSSDKLTCTAKTPGDSELWHIHLAARPQVNLRSVGRKRFAHLSENLDEIHVDANIPWGEDTLFTLEFHADEDGKYALHTCNNKYLSNGGKLVETCNKDCLFSAEYHSGQLALRDRNGQYLSPIGSKAVLKTRSNTVTKDELFSLEDSLPQASFVAALNSRYVSVKQGVDVTANQDEISDHETFQLEFDWSTKRWYIRTMQDKYWTLETGGGIQASGEKRSSNALFDLVWQGDGSLAFRANNGRYVITKRSGHLYATSDVIDDNCKYFFYLINRPILVLKCEQGFVGYKSASSPKLECNKATYECIQVERAEKGIIHFKGQNGKYWHVDSEGVTADSDAPEGFYLELREPTRLCIKTANGNYLTASKNGLFRLGDSAIENATQWEY